MKDTTMNKIDQLFLALDTSLDRVPSVVTLDGLWGYEGEWRRAYFTITAEERYGDIVLCYEGGVPFYAVSREEITLDEEGFPTFTASGAEYRIDRIRKTETDTYDIW